MRFWLAALLLGGVAHAGDLDAWAKRAARKGRPTAAMSVPADVRQLFEVASSRVAEGGEAKLVWVHALNPARLLALAEVKAIGGPDRAVLTLVALEEGVFVTYGQAVVPHAPNPAAWSFGGVGDVDGDGRPDAVARWTATRPEGRRRGLVLVRTAPPGVAALELELEPAAGSAARRIEAPVACFARVEGLTGRALVWVRRSSTPGSTDPLDVVDIIEVRVPGAAGELVATGLYAAQVLPAAPEKQARATWARTFGGGSEARQRNGSACPSEGLLLPARTLTAGGRGADQQVVIGPLATTPEGVRARMARDTRKKRAARPEPPLVRLGG